MPAVRKLLAHTKNFFLIQGEVTEAFLRDANAQKQKKVPLLDFKKEWQKERVEAWKNLSEYTTERLSGWSLYYERNFIDAEVFVVLGRRVYEDGKIEESDTPSTWFTGGRENCRHFLAFLHQKGNLINDRRWDLDIDIYSKARKNYESLLMQEILEKDFEFAGDRYFMSKRNDDFLMYSVPMIRNGKHKDQFSNFESFYKSRDNWQATLLQKIEIVGEIYSSNC